MKATLKVSALVAALVVSASAFAQDNVPLTRWEVRSELVELEKAGYHVGDGNQAQYPVALQAALSRIATKNNRSNDVGGVSEGSTAAGVRVASKSLYSAP